MYTQNSTYEINTDDSLIRRLTGKVDPTSRQGQDGQWQSYTQIVPCQGGLLINWADERCTLTSQITNPAILDEIGD